jgi:hypothetical protein
MIRARQGSETVCVGRRAISNSEHFGHGLLMQNFGIPRRVVGGQKDERAPINWRRGLFRLWLVISAAWVMAWAIFLIMEGIQGGVKTTRDFLVLPVLLFGPPIALLLFGVAAGWAFRGFKVDNDASSN